MKVQQQLQKLKNGVFRFQEQLMDVRPSPDVVDKLRETMSDIENSISAFKDSQHQSFEELLKDERSVWQEICVVQKKMESWSVSVRAEAGGRRSEKPRSWTSLPAEVSALQTFLQRTGRDGGWDPFDHRSFLKVWTKHRGKPSYRREARLYLPEKTEEELKKHEDWFLELRRLQDDKREAIRRWRAWKQTEREQRDGDEEPEEEEEERDQEDEEERRRELSERLEVWRRHRTQQRERQQEQSLRQQILESRRAKEQRRRQLELKLLVEERLQQKKEQEERRLLEREAQEQAERQERQRQAVLGIRRFQQRVRGACVFESRSPLSVTHSVSLSLVRIHAGSRRNYRRRRLKSRSRARGTGHSRRSRTRFTSTGIRLDSGSSLKRGRSALKRRGPRGPGPCLRSSTELFQRGDKTPERSTASDSNCRVNEVSLEAPLKFYSSDVLFSTEDPEIESKTN
ncbi:coiled-coil domain-containing protein 112 isoform X2 [Puntigrus tetrazona]|nr:coiled-coil domain-containing protein 112 isoform X2 [Puntigrus tetrazona]